MRQYSVADDKIFKMNKKNDEANCLGNRYRLNAGNYVAELHKALLKECNDNLIDFSVIKPILVRESLSDISCQTFKAIKVRYLTS